MKATKAVPSFTIMPKNHAEGCIKSPDTLLVLSDEDNAKDKAEFGLSVLEATRSQTAKEIIDKIDEISPNIKDSKLWQTLKEEYGVK